MAKHESKKAVIAALTGNTLIAITKFIAAVMSGSSAMLSEALHSCVDCCKQLLLLYGMRRAARPADTSHPYGYGKELYFWTLVVAVLVFALGAGLSIYEGVMHLEHPQLLTNIHITYAVLAAALVFEGISWWNAWREIRRRRRQETIFQGDHRTKDPTLIAVLFEDSAAMMGLMVALDGIAARQVFHAPLFDALASIGIGLILGAVALWLAYESKGLLVGESVDPQTLEDIRRIITADSRVMRLADALTMHLGPDDVLLTLDVDFADRLSTSEVEDTVVDLEQRIQRHHPEVKRIFIEAKSWSRRKKGADGGKDQAVSQA